jgi:hypothetical protein
VNLRIVEPAFLFGISVGVVAARAEAPAQLKPLAFLIGEWEAGTNTGPHGQGSGRYEFEFDLQEKVIIRHNHAEYPAAATSPALLHDDLMVIYIAQDATVQAQYYDSEGHVIHYVAKVSAPGEASFVSDVIAGTPRYGLTYKLRGAGILEGKFEVAPPGQPDAFKQYLAWESRRARKA